ETSAGNTEEETERVVELGRERQGRLDEEPPLDLWVIHDEAVIRRTIGGPAVMRSQLAHLLAEAGRPGTTLQVLPFDSGAHAGHDGPFSIIEFQERSDSEVAYVESAAGPLYLEKDREVRTRSEAFDRLRAT